MAHSLSIDAPLAGPAGSSVLVAAVSWLEVTLLGSVATSAAVIAVACVGLMMLGGRIELRRGATVIIGSFILFGATSIAAGLQSLTSPEPAATPVAPPPLTDLPPTHPTDLADAYDPYAGASVAPR